VTTFPVLQAPLFSRTANPRVYRQRHPARRFPGLDAVRPQKNDRHSRRSTRPAWARYAM